MSVLLIIFGCVLFCNGVCMCFISNFNIGVILTVLLGALLLLWGIFYGKIKEASKKGVLKTVRIVLVCALCLELIFVVFIAVFGAYDNADYTEDAVIVLGAGLHGDRITIPLKQRLDKAIEYHERNPEAYLVVSGGQGPGETVTEAFAMEEYLILHGVPQSCIIKEERATSTAENMRYSKVILDELFEKEYKTAIITNNFHIYRAQCLARRENLVNTSHLHAPLQVFNLAPCYLRETLAVLKMWILE